MKPLERFAPWVIAGCSIAACCVLVFWPVVRLYVGTVFGDGGEGVSPYATVLSERRQWNLLISTLCLGVGTSLCSSVLGGLIGVAVGIQTVARQRLLIGALALPLLLPPYVVAVVWSDALAATGFVQYGLAATAVFADSSLRPIPMLVSVLVLSLTLFPIPAYAAIAGLRNCDPQQIEAGLLAVGRARTAWRVMVPMVGRPLLSAAMVVFLLCLVEFSVPSLLQVNVYPVEIFERFSVSYNPGEATALATPVVAIGLLALWGWAGLVGKQRARGRARGGVGRVLLGASALAWLHVFVWVVVVLAALTPLVVLFVQSLPLSIYREVWLTAQTELRTSVMMSVASALVVTVLSIMMALTDSSHRAIRWVYLAVCVGFLISGPLLGIALIGAWNHVGVRGWVYDSWLILVIAFAGRYLCVGYLFMRAAMAGIPKGFDDAARLAGVSWARRAVRLQIPLLMPAAMIVFVGAASLALRDVDLAVLLAPPGANTVGVRVFSLMHYGPTRLVAALSVTIALLSLGIGAAGVAVAGRIGAKHDVGH